MQFRVGYELIYDFPQPTPIILVVNVHESRASDLVVSDRPTSEPSSADHVVSGRVRQPVPPRPRASGTTPPHSRWHRQRQRSAGYRMSRTPARTRCRTCRKRPSCSCWAVAIVRPTFCRTRPGNSSAAPRQGTRACRPSATSFTITSTSTTRMPAPIAPRLEAFNERTGVCRDYAHLAIAFCRCMNIPARYCTGYLSDVGTPPPYAVGDFAAWFEAWIGGRWHMFDPRNNVPRIGRILMARGPRRVATSPSPRLSDPIPSRASASGPMRFQRTRVAGVAALMSFLTVRHSTVYRYREPVRLGEHRMMFRPRASHDLRLIQAHLAITPQPAAFALAARSFR